MHTFTDNSGEEWSIKLDTGVLKTLRKELDIDLLGLDESSFVSLVSDDEKLVDIVSFLCTSQIEQRDMDANSFAAAIIGNAIEDACNALVDELVFISRPSRQAVIKTMWTKATTAVDRLNQEAVTVMESPEMQKRLDEIVSQFGNSLKTST